MTIVIDLGCAPHDGETSIEWLIAKFQPVILVGLDPALERVQVYGDGDTLVVLIDRAAWLYDGEVSYIYEGLRSRIGEFGQKAHCLDFPRFLRDFADDEIICKMDIEGAEIPLLEALHEAGDDALLELLLIEWHEHMPEWTDELAARRDHLVEVLRCPIAKWHG